MKTRLLKETGQLLCGLHWQQPLAQLLGREHSDGRRGKIDEQLVKRWVKGHQAVPDWVVPALHQLVARRAMALNVMAERLRQEQTKKDPGTEAGAKVR